MTWSNIPFNFHLKVRANAPLLMEGSADADVCPT
jgi:hypothetical protein